MDKKQFEESEKAKREESVKNAPTVHDMVWFYRWLDGCEKKK